MFTIEDAKRVQRDLGLGDRHVVYFDPDEGFVLAHTDAEREAGMDLTTCRFHYWLCKLGEDPSWALWVGNGFPGSPGWYEMEYLTVARGLAL